MAIITLEEYKTLCWLDLLDTSGDLLLQKYIDASISQIESAVWGNPCLNDSDGNPILKSTIAKKYDFDCSKAMTTWGYLSWETCR